MNQLQLFDFENSKIGALSIDGEAYFVGNDVAITLGYSNYRNAVANHVDDEDKLRTQIKYAGQFRKMTLINQSGLYSLILSSKMPNARKFKHWVTSEVLPAIREHGAYMTDEKAFDVVHNKDGLASLLQQAADQLREKDIQIEKMKPKALFADSVATSDSTVLVGELAKILRGNGVDIGATRLFRWMRANGYLISRKGSDRNMPTQKAMNLGLFKIKETTITHSDGHVTVTKTPKVTGKGQQYFINKFLKQRELVEEQVTIMDDLQRGIYRMVVKEVARTQPKREKNFLSKRDAEKLIKKYTKRYALQEYLNATEAADVLGMSLTTFWRFRQEHNVPVHVIDGIKRYRKSELIDCVEENSVRGYAQGGTLCQIWAIASLIMY